MTTDTDPSDLLSASQPVANRLKAYDKITSLAKDLGNGIQLRSACKKFSEKKSIILDDIMSDNGTLAFGGLNTLAVIVQDDQVIRSFSPFDMSSVLSTLCAVLLKTKDKTVANRALFCLAKQLFPEEVLVSHVHPIVCATEHVFTQFASSSTVIYEGLGLLSRLLEKLPKQMATAVSRWTPLVLEHIGSPADAVSMRALAAFKGGLPVMQASREALVTLLLSAIKKHVAAGLERGVKGQRPVEILQCWSAIVHLLGRDFHRSSFINLMLRCVEAGFHASSADVKVAAFAAWRSLCDNFAEDTEVLRDVKRVKLVMQVFNGKTARVEAVAIAKLDAWWHYICLLKDAALQQPHFDMVLLPYLCFCFGLDVDSCISINVASIANGNVPLTPRSNRTVPSSSPSPKMTLRADTPGGGTANHNLPAFKERGSKVLAYMLGIANEYVQRRSEHPPTGIRVNNEVFIQHASTIAAAVRAALLECNGNESDTLLLALWSHLVDNVVTVLDSCSRQKSTELITSLLSNLQIILLSCSTEGHRPEHCLGLMSDLLRLPPRVLTSSSYCLPSATAVGCCPALSIIDLLILHGWKHVSSASESARLSALLDELILGGSSSPGTVLTFCGKVVLLLEKQTQASAVPAELQQVVCAIVWSSAAERIICYIQQGGEVNEGTALSYSFACLYQVLLFPLKFLCWRSIPQVRHATLLSRWVMLCKGLSKEASLVVSAPVNIWCEELCSGMLQHISSHEGFLKDFLWLDKLASMLACIYEGLDVSTSSNVTTPANTWKSQRGKNRAHLMSFTKLLAKLLDALHTAALATCEKVDAEDRSAAITAACSTVMVTAHHLLQRVPAPLVADVVIACSGTVAAVLGRPSGDSGRSHPKFFSQFGRLWQAMSGSLQQRYNGSFDAKLLAALSPLLIALLSSGKRRVRSEALALWRATFAKTKNLPCPEELRHALAEAVNIPDRPSVAIGSMTSIDIERDSVTPSPPLSDSPSQVELPAMPGLPSPRKPLGSFLSRDKPLAAKASGSGSPVASSSMRLAPSPSSRLSTSPAVKARKQASPGGAVKKEDFVFIAPSPKRKLLLTEHQKEKMREKRSLPLMYNGLDASQDTTCFAASQEDSISQSTPSAGHCNAPTVESSQQVAALRIEASDSAEFIDLRHDNDGTMQVPSSAPVANTAVLNQEQGCAAEDGNQASKARPADTASDTGSGIPVTPVKSSHSTLQPGAHSICLADSPRKVAILNCSPKTKVCDRSPKAKVAESSQSCPRMPKGRRLSQPSATGRAGLHKWFPSVSSQEGQCAASHPVTVCAVSHANQEQPLKCSGSMLPDLSSLLVADGEQLAEPMDDDAKLKMSSASYIGSRKQSRSASVDKKETSGSVHASIKDNSQTSTGKSSSLSGEPMLLSSCGSPSADEMEQIMLEKSFEGGCVSITSPPGQTIDDQASDESLVGPGLCSMADGHGHGHGPAIEGSLKGKDAEINCPGVSQPLLSDHEDSENLHCSSNSSSIRSPSAAASDRQSPTRISSLSLSVSQSLEPRENGDPSSAAVNESCTQQTKKRRQSTLSQPPRPPQRPVTRRSLAASSTLSQECGADVNAKEDSGPAIDPPPAKRARGRPPAKDKHPRAAVVAPRGRQDRASAASKQEQPLFNPATALQAEAAALSPCLPAAVHTGCSSMVEAPPDGADAEALDGNGVIECSLSTDLNEDKGTSGLQSDEQEPEDTTCRRSVEETAANPLPVSEEVFCVGQPSHQPAEPTNVADSECVLEHAQPLIKGDSIGAVTSSVVAHGSACVTDSEPLICSVQPSVSERPADADVDSDVAYSKLAYEKAAGTAHCPAQVEVDEKDSKCIASTVSAGSTNGSEDAGENVLNLLAGSSTTGDGEQSVSTSDNCLPSANDGTVAIRSTDTVANCMLAPLSSNDIASSDQTDGIAGGLASQVVVSSPISSSHGKLLRTGSMAGRKSSSTRAVGSWRMATSMRRSAEILRRSLDLSAAAAATAATSFSGVEAACAQQNGSSSSRASLIPVSPAAGRAVCSSPQQSSFGVLQTVSQPGQYAFSPSASPSASILKRRSISTALGDENQSPSIKPRRVSFAATVEVATSDGVSPARRCLPVGIMEAERSAEESLDDVKGANGQGESLTLSSSSENGSDVCSSAVYRSTPESQVDCRLPVCPELAGSILPVNVILPMLAPSSWLLGLANVLKSRSIITVGDVASLTEYDVLHELPIRHPKLAVVKKALHSLLQQKDVTVAARLTSSADQATSVAATSINDGRDLADITSCAPVELTSNDMMEDSMSASDMCSSNALHAPDSEEAEVPVQGLLAPKALDRKRETSLDVTSMQPQLSAAFVGDGPCTELLSGTAPLFAAGNNAVKSQESELVPHAPCSFGERIVTDALEPITDMSNQEDTCPMDTLSTVDMSTISAAGAAAMALGTVSTVADKSNMEAFDTSAIDNSSSKDEALVKNFLQHSCVGGSSVSTAEGPTEPSATMGSGSCAPIAAYPCTTSLGLSIDVQASTAGAGMSSVCEGEGDRYTDTDLQVHDASQALQHLKFGIIAKLNSMPLSDILTVQEHLCELMAAVVAEHKARCTPSAEVMPTAGKVHQ